IITGGSRGIGYSIAKKFYDEGHNLVLISSSDKIYEVFKENDRVLKYKADVTNYDALNKLFKDLVKLSDIDCLINSAGISINGPLSIQSESAISKVLNINLMGTIYTNKLTSKMFLKNKKQGSIINISSVIGLIGNPGQSIYSASKSGVIGLTKSLAKELGPRNIRVNCIAPGFINSDMTKG
ncbi:NAD(P)-binding protein, partial [Neoconidiobolus thromboides FSU 785]